MRTLTLAMLVMLAFGCCAPCVPWGQNNYVDTLPLVSANIRAIDADSVWRDPNDADTMSAELWPWSIPPSPDTIVPAIPPDSCRWVYGWRCCVPAAPRVTVEVFEGEAFWGNWERTDAIMYRDSVWWCGPDGSREIER